MPRPPASVSPLWLGAPERQVVDFVTRELHENVLRELRKGQSAPDALLQAFTTTDEEPKKGKRRIVGMKLVLRIGLHGRNVDC